MEKAVIFNFTDYKAFLRDVFQRPNNRGLLTEAAAALDCGKSYLSRILSEKMDLSTDQGFRLSQFLGLNKDEAEYFVLSVDFSRSPSRSYKEHLRTKMQAIKSRYEQKQLKGADPIIESGLSDLEYYSNWFMIPIHLMTSFKGGVSARQVAECLRLDESLVRSCLATLVTRNLVAQDRERYHFADGAHFLPAQHPLMTVMHRTLREQALLDVQHKREKCLHVSSWYCMNEDDYQKVRSLLIGALERINKIAEPSPSEKVVGLNIDFFDPFLSR